jgi:hypothetical protein
MGNDPESKFSDVAQRATALYKIGWRELEIWPLAPTRDGLLS